jgi:hypothetical protein
MEHVGYRLQTIVLVSKQQQEELNPPVLLQRMDFKHVEDSANWVGELS